ncbi:MAG: hypothetical protein IJO27_00215 [Bacilli bacterium]|nr:hypothetical protein [Bacilli bacterium]
MKKKILSMLCGVLVLGALTGCGNNNATTGNGGDVSGGGASTNTKGNCTAVECIKKINPEHTVEQINNIIGFEGELLDEKYQKYYWELSEDTGVQVAYYSSSKGQISIDYDRDSLANNKVDFSRYSELKAKIEGTDGITYNDFITYIGNVQGTVIEKSSYSTKYVWVASDGSYLNGSFSSSSGKCTFASGMIK